MTPPSLVVTWQRLKPVAINCSSLGVGQQVAGELLDDELVERQVAIERPDDPIAVGPHLAVVVEVQAVRVAVAGGVEPEAGHVLAVARRREQPIDRSLVGVGAIVGEEGVDLRRRRRQAGEVERDAAQQRDAIGLDGEASAFLVRVARG